MLQCNRNRSAPARATPLDVRPDLARHRVRVHAIGHAIAAWPGGDAQGQRLAVERAGKFDEIRPGAPGYGDFRAGREIRRGIRQDRAVDVRPQNGSVPVARSRAGKASVSAATVPAWPGPERGDPTATEGDATMAMAASVAPPWPVSSSGSGAAFRHPVTSAPASPVSTNALKMRRTDTIMVSRPLAERPET
jgi:hypothetical protein